MQPWRAPDRASAARVAAVNRSLDGGPITRNRTTLWALAACGIGLDGFDLFIMSTAGPLIAADFGLDPWMKSIAVGAAVLGAVPGALVSGRLADRIGRQNMLKIDIALFAATAVLSALAPNIWWLAAFRFLQGFAVGAEYPLSASLISEIMPSRSRAQWITAAFAFQALGMAAAALSSVLILQVVQDVSAWRWMLLAGAVPATIIALLRLGKPESPRWEAGRGRLDYAERGTAWLLGSPPVVTEEDLASVADTWDRPPESTRMRELWQPGLRRVLVLTAVPWFLMDISLYGVGLFTPSLITGLLFSPEDESGGTHFLRDDFEATAITGATDMFLVVGFLLTILFVRRIGQIRLQVIGFLGMTIGLAVLALSGTDGAPALVILGFVVFNLMVNFGPNATTYMIPAQLYPTRLRATGHGTAAAAGKVGAVIGTFALSPAVAAFGISPVMAVIAVLSLAGAIVTVLARVEPKPTLE
jgi:MFS family permease